MIDPLVLEVSRLGHRLAEASKLPPFNGLSVNVCGFQLARLEHLENLNFSTGRWSGISQDPLSGIISLQCHKVGPNLGRSTSKVQRIYIFEVIRIPRSLSVVIVSAVLTSLLHMYTVRALHSKQIY